MQPKGKKGMNSNYVGKGRLLVALMAISQALGFLPIESRLGSRSRSREDRTFGSQCFLTKLPQDISPFEKSSSKQSDVQGIFRKLALEGIQKALKDDHTRIEIEFPPLIGGDQSKSQFDDFDNVQELNKNRDWCIEWLPTLSNAHIAPTKERNAAPIWFILPDLKEVELAKEEWGGQLFRQSAKFTSIEAVTNHYAKNVDGGDSVGYNKPWGATFASGMNKLLGGGGDSENSEGKLLGDPDSLDPLTTDAQGNPTVSLTPKLHLVCQPGNGGPVEDWVNVMALHTQAQALSESPTPTCIVNGALDKVRDGYYPGLIFPKLATTFDFYKSFEAAFFIKPLSDKGLYGWVFRVYPEPWQVVLQRPTRNPKNDALVIEDKVVLVSDTRPSYPECIQALVQGSKEA